MQMCLRHLINYLPISGYVMYNRARHIYDYGIRLK